MTETKPVESFEVHDVHEIIPDMSDEEWKSFRNDVEENGILDPVKVDPNNTDIILDGRHRLKAAKELGFDKLKYEKTNLNGISPAEYATKSALLRRHLSKSQKAMLAAKRKSQFEEEAKEREKEGGKLGGKYKGKENLPDPSKGQSREKAGELFGVSGRSVEKAEKIMEAAEENPDEYGNLKKKAEQKSLHSAYNELKRRKEKKQRRERTKNAPELKNLLLGDCLERVSQIPDKSIHCVVTDPPYGIGCETGARDTTQELRKGEWGYEGDDATIFPLLEELFQKLEPKLKEDAHVYLFTSWKVWGRLISVVRKFYTPAGWIGYLHYLATGGHFSGYRGGLSSVMFAVNGDGRRISGDGWNFIDVSGSRRKERDHHPAQKSVEICKRLIKNSTVEGELVLDPFCGSGSTLVAAEELDRDWFGIEKEKRWFETAKSRIWEVRENGD